MSFEITILGSSSAMPTYERHLTSQYLKIKNQHFLIDCGEGTQFQLIKYRFRYNKINHIFISHLHGDHYLGLPGLLSSMHLNKRLNDLHLYGPLGLDEILLTNFKHSNTVLNFNVIFHPISPDNPYVIYENEQLEISTLPLTHRIPCTGFLIKEKPKQRRIIPEKLPAGISFEQFKQLKAGIDINFRGRDIISTEVTLPPKKSRSYAFCSDTCPLLNLIPLIKDVDLLYHEATFTDKYVERAALTYHSTAAQAASIAAKANVHKLIVGHFSARYKDLTPILEEAKEVFTNTVLAEDGKRFSIEED